MLTLATPDDQFRTIGLENDSFDHVFDLKTANFVNMDIRHDYFLLKLEEWPFKE